jgi:3-methyladenine DNA glycosylase AlkD
VTAADAVLAELVTELRTAADPERAPREKAYLKSDLEHWGTPVPTVRRLTTRAVRHLDRPTLLAVVTELWHEPVHERRAAAAFALAARTDLLDDTDAVLLERLLRESRTWALVDVLAPRVVGPLLAREPAAWHGVLDAWATDADFWLRRAVLLAFLVPLRDGTGDFDTFCRYAEPMLTDREFFVAKAIGWVLRDTGRRRPELVSRWVVPRASVMSRVTLREAVKPLDPEQVAQILATAPAPRRRASG